MSFPIPDLPTLRAQIRGFFQSRLGTDPTLRRSNAAVQADALAGGLHLQYRYLTNVAAQLFIDQAATGYLDRWAAIYALPRLGATPAAGNAVFTGTSGVSIPSGTIVKAADGVTAFATQATVTLSGGTATVAIIATTPGSAGTAGNLLAAAPLTLQTAIPGVNGTANVDSAGLSGGTDIEADAALRARLLARIRQPPHGGAWFDYVAWAKQVLGVTRAWVYPQNRGAGTVDIGFVCDGRASIIPLTADVTAVQAVLTNNRPVTADAQAITLTADSKNITITGLVPNTSAMQAAVTASLAALFSRATPGGASNGDGIDANNPAGKVFVEQISAAIAGTPGVANFDLTSPSSDITSASTHIPVLGTVTFL